MTSAIENSPYTPAQIQMWLRGLLTVAWADGQFETTEKMMIHAMVESEFAPGLDFETLEPIQPEQLSTLDLSPGAAQNFLRMAVMVALADGVYSEPENTKIMSFAEALALDAEALESLRSTLSKIQEIESTVTETTASAESAAVETSQTAAKTDLSPAEVAESVDISATSAASSSLEPPAESSTKIDPLKPARKWLDQLSVDDPRLARFVCKLVPAQCPFERDVKLFGHKVVHIPPMCKLNPLYEQLVGLRFRALCYLADDCGEDVSAYT